MENNRWVSVTTVDGKTWETFEVGSWEHHVATLTILESKWSFVSEIQQFCRENKLKSCFIFWSWNRLWSFLTTNKCHGSCCISNCRVILKEIYIISYGTAGLRFTKHTYALQSPVKIQSRESQGLLSQVLLDT